jgi:uncharacterized protein (DUF1778 family)
MASPKTIKRGRGRPATGQMPPHQFRCRQEDWELLQQAAQAEGLEASAFIRHAALSAARRVLKRHDER